ncbi:molybdate ABC transporter permease subunit [Rhodovibrio salinarum]|uniref:Molybdenum transport system permease n=1 Tax=Rhodovibrio salinarum TaxID=1087 RepID=A0A934V0U2_9PROT|nr:molybdate ABC transporter permease subunit [Rhodovibrio salinarum]MBK1698682.1 molybdate ABC transporter permease subunit [Rhodovibrio salinarum]
MIALTELEQEALTLSLRVAVWAVATGLPAALAVAWLLARREFPGKTLLNGVVHLPLVLPPVVVGYLLLLTFGRQGPVGGWLDESLGVTIAFTWQGAALAAAVMAFPLMVRAIRLSLEAVDTRLESAARTLGAGRLEVFVTITLPLTAPGLLAGAILGFARSLGEFGATITFVSNIPGETRTLPLALYSLVQQPDGESGALRMAAISVVLALVALAASELLARRVKARIAG